MRRSPFVFRSALFGTYPPGITLNLCICIGAATIPLARKIMCLIGEFMCLVGKIMSLIRNGKTLSVFPNPIRHKLLPMFRTNGVL